MRTARGTLIVTALPLILILVPINPVHAEPCRLDRGPVRTVARVIDAETLQLDDGSVARLAGIVAPRARDAGVEDGRWPSEAAARLALDALATSKSVQLAFDGTRTDRHGTLLVHVFPRPSDKSVPDTAHWASAKSLQEELLAAGYARVDAIEGQRSCLTRLLAAEAEARADARGLWREPAYRVRAATPSRDIAAYRGSFQILTGTVRRVESSGNVVRLILGEDRRRDVSLLIRSTDRSTLGALGGDAKRLEGRQVEARGWLITRASGGPEIDLSLAGHVRLLEGEPNAPARAPPKPSQP